MDPGAAEQSISPIWLSHHAPDEYDRCIAVGRAHVCRRCLVLYPVTFAALILARAGLRWPMSLDVLLILGLSLPTVAELLGVTGGGGTIPRRPSPFRNPTTLCRVP